MPDWVVPLIVALFSTGGVGGVFVLLRKEFRQAPVERETAMVANAMAVSTGYKELVNVVNARLAIQDAKVDAQDQKIYSQDTIIGGLRAETQTLRDELRKWTLWYAGFVNNWFEHRKGESAPPPPN